MSTSTRSTSHFHINARLNASCAPLRVLLLLIESRASRTNQRCGYQQIFIYVGLSFSNDIYADDVSFCVNMCVSVYSIDTDDFEQDKKRYHSHTNPFCSDAVQKYSFIFE